MQRRRITFAESWKIASGAGPGASYEPEMTVYAIGIPIVAVWYWITGVPESDTPGDDR